MSVEFFSMDPPVDVHYVHSGQGSQRRLMGAEVAGDSEAALDVYEQGTKVLADGGYKFDGKPIDLRYLCFEATDAELLPTVITQLAIVATSRAAEVRFQEAHPQIKPLSRVGNSVGELSALVSGGVLDFDYAIDLTYHRARYMEEAAAKLRGTPMEGGIGAARNLESYLIEFIVKNVNKENGTQAEIAGLNTPTQVTVSGTNNELDLVGAAVKEADGKFSTLKVSVPVHSRLIAEAEQRLKDHIGDGKHFHDPAPEAVVLNRTGEYATSGAEIAQALPEQLTHTVRLMPSMYLIAGFRAGGDDLEGNRKRNKRRHVIAEMSSGRVMTDLNKYMEAASDRVVTVGFDEAMVTGLDWNLIKQLRLQN